MQDYNFNYKGIIGMQASSHVLIFSRPRHLDVLIKLMKVNKKTPFISRCRWSLGKMYGFLITTYLWAANLNEENLHDHDNHCSQVLNMITMSDIIILNKMTMDLNLKMRLKKYITTADCINSLKWADAVTGSIFLGFCF
jgi:hypothetical protein